ncbi:MAG TPA: sulfur carrier protein ThiS [Bacillaceae bacterium]|nr:sulfur carrier protein ThiS [Bacillaceae bacterium]
MNFQLNGKQVQLPEEVNSVDKLLAHYDLQHRIAVVEINQNIIKKEEYENTRLANGDVIEIIHFVGGG